MISRKLRRWLLTFVAVSTAAAQTNQPVSPSRSVMLHVVATDSDGRPVAGLTTNDFKVSDSGKLQEITAFSMNQGKGPVALVLFFDLLNLNFSNAGFEWDQIKKSMPEMPASDSLYLYLLVKDGSIYPVHGLPAPGAVEAQPNTAWIQNIGPLLDAAMKKVNQLKPNEIRTQVSVRFQVTCNALDALRAQMARLPGRKELVWVTYGIPSTVRDPVGNRYDCTPMLRQLAGRFDQSNVAIYTVDPALNLGRSMLSRDTLQILTGGTGGRSFTSSDLRSAVVQAVADARTNYSLQYVPAADSWNDKFHQVRVSCERKGVHILAEQGYFATREH